MICPVVSFSVALRLPFTAIVDVTPSRAALPPNMLTIRPSMPSNSTRDLLVGADVGANGASDSRQPASAQRGNDVANRFHASSVASADAT